MFITQRTETITCQTKLEFFFQYCDSNELEKENKDNV